MDKNNRIEKVAIVGAGGHLGTHFAEELLLTGLHTVTAITRQGSTSKLPAGVNKVEVNYDDEESLVTALQGQQFLVITLAVLAPPETHRKIVTAAVKAGVPYIMPNVYGYDPWNIKLGEEDLYGANSLKLCKEVEILGGTFIAMVCGFWYEWCLARGSIFFGFDIEERSAIFFDDGKTLVNFSTFRQCGRALAALLSLPENGSSPSVSDWSNTGFYIDSFKICQRDMLDSLHRVVGTTDIDWKMSYESTAQRFKDGRAELQEGKTTGFAKTMVSRVFFPNGDGDYESSRGLANNLLGLPKDNLDEATKLAVDASAHGKFGRIEQLKSGQKPSYAT